MPCHSFVMYFLRREGQENVMSTPSQKAKAHHTAVMISDNGWKPYLPRQYGQSCQGFEIHTMAARWTQIWLTKQVRVRCVDAQADSLRVAVL